MKKLNLSLLVLTLILSFFGLLMVFEASSSAAAVSLGDKYHFLKEQAKWLILGTTVMVFLAFFDYKKLYPLAIIFLLATLVLLVGVFIPGLGLKAKGASRWLDLQMFQVQPAEFAKLSIIIYFAAWFSAREKERLMAFLLLGGMVLGLIVLEPDLGTAVVVMTVSLVMYFLSGAPFWQFAVLLPAAAFSVIGLSIFSPYRYERLKTFFDPRTDPLGASYHLRQILLTLGSGGLWGVGLGQSRQKYQFLPEAMTDSIFAIIGEEFGFVGAGLVVILLGFLVLTSFKIAFAARDQFGKLLGLGIATWLGIQALVNLSAMVALIPLTGVPLPFISYGGSALITEMAGIGILLSISRHKK